MRKILLVSLLAVIALAACQEKKPQYKIDGKVVGEMDGKTVYLMPGQGRNIQTTAAIDSAVITAGTFTLTGSVETPDAYTLMIMGTERVGVRLFVENASIQAVIDTEVPQNTVASGSPLNDLYTSYNKSLSTYQTQMRDISNQAKELQSKGEMTDELDTQLLGKFTELQEGMKAYQLKFIGDNSNSIVSAFLLRDLANSLSIEEMEEYTNKFDTIIGKTQYITSIKEEVVQMKKTAVGQKFTDFKLKTPEGNEISLSDYAGKGNYVLLDFWASWCGPCRHENPNVVKLYEKYKSKGFEIVGVSLDQDKDAWIKAIKDDGITWPQMLNERGEKDASTLYGVKAIPTIILLDKDGIIIEKGLRGEKLGEKLGELLGA